MLQHSQIIYLNYCNSKSQNAYQSRSAGTIFDTGSKELSDFDIAISSPQILERAKELGLPTRSKGRRALLDAKALEKLGLDNLVESLSNRVGREVNFMVFDSIESALTKKDTFSIIPTLR